MTWPVIRGRAAAVMVDVGLRAERTGPGRDVIKIIHRPGIKPDDVATPLLSPKRVLDLDEVVQPPLALEGL